ncbi:hypothetical protein BDV38DRAFT_290004 [Aspergillus pseudotamarii]|uniref:Zn(2)-C6 fungal-type domain-containing protein n=1 Tax=Aspergillus pseudotamarii TaxID=132259 RepID=A0A5N6SDZ8_ASPPS|nr:uncharacterized protein BDV38DRAFT_290004 [Aspergillus pseudotamarii]KAE8131633.1 hypothetical protein BDV38DRAFT_290004 [Aspergillus pseudotamarii]
MPKLEGGIRQNRKPRGRGIRATTGCLICKHRHVKCDEAHPQCGPCAKGQRPCVYAPQHSPRRRPARQESLHAEASTGENAAIPTPTPSNSYVPSAGTESSVTARVVPSRWLELSAKDATNANAEFPLSPPQLSRNRIETGENLRNSSNLRPHTLKEQESRHAAAFPRGKEIEPGIVSQPPGTAPVATKTTSLWTSKYPIPLSNLEHYLFGHFVRITSKLLDFYDPEMHFATTVPHIALRNVGLMRALLALSARHLTLGESEKEQFAPTSIEKNGIPGRQEDIIDRNLAVEYYLETLAYLNKAMQYPLYARSLDMIATVILISTYEMINGSNQHWKRHIKGVFWIQKLQENNGESGGLRSAVWWAWLQQDIWIAMRERRRVFSLWNPKMPVSTLTAPELATRVIYLLSQCINYASKEEEKASNIEHRLDWGNKLLFLLQEWHETLPPAYSPLPSVSKIEIFPPIWVNPPSYAAALQIHSLALILVILHRPSSSDLDDYRAAQHMLAVSVSTICGIARSVDENDDERT